MPKSQWIIRARRLKEQGFASYKDYLKSQKWSNAKRRAIKYYKSKKCQVCVKNRLDMFHHKTYWNLGKEKPWDILPICKECHKSKHGKLQRTLVGKYYID